MTVFVLPLFEPDLNSRCRGQFRRTANHGSICDSSPPWRWAYDYFWLCVGAYGSDWSSAVAGTSAPLILTHDPCIWHTKPERVSKRRALAISTHFVSLCSCFLKPPAISSFPDQTAPHVSKELTWSPPAAGRSSSAPNWAPSRASPAPRSQPERAHSDKRWWPHS